MRTVAVILRVPGARVYLDDVTPPGGHSGIMPADGYLPFTVTHLPITYLTVEATGYQPYVVHGLALPPGDIQIRIGVAGDPGRPQDVILPGLIPLIPHLEIRGHDFVDAAGNRKVFKGTDQFCAFRRYLDGVDLTPLFQESQELHFDMWRVFMMGSQAQNNILELRPSAIGATYYDHLRPFADLLNANGIVLLSTVFVDAQDVMPVVSDQRDHWGWVADRLRGSATLESGGNEFEKNGFNPGDLSDPGMIWSRGSGTQDAEPFRPVGSFCEFHPVRHYPTLLLDSVASPVTLFDKGYTQPLIIDEPTGFGDPSNPFGKLRETDPRLAYRLARHYSTECAGAVLHNEYGMRCLPMSAHMRTIAEAWQRGMLLG